MLSFLFSRHQPATLPPDERLLGTWRSNRELSVATMRRALMFRPPELRERFFDVFGDLTVTFTSTSLGTTWPRRHPCGRHNHTAAYRVVASGPDSVSFRSEPRSRRGPKVMVVHFVGPDRYWMDVSHIRVPVDTTGWREYFDRVASPGGVGLLQAGTFERAQAAFRSVGAAHTELALPSA